MFNTYFPSIYILYWYGFFREFLFAFSCIARVSTPQWVAFSSLISIPFPFLFLKKDIYLQPTGTALPSIVSLFANAASVAITDHPSSSALGPTGAIRKNLEKNVPETLLSRACVHAHEWGDLDSSFAKDSKGLFSRIIVADCLWIKGQHENLVKTILWFLSEGGDSNGDSKGGSNGTVWVVAGFHTGRKIVASFFDTAVNMGLEIEEIWEKDVNAKDEEDGDTLRAEREWRPFRDGEDPYQSRRWCVVAFLRRKKDPYRAGSWKQCFRNFIHCSR